MRKFSLLLAAAAFAISATASASVFDHRPAERRVAERLRDGDTVQLATESYDQMFDVAEKLLRQHDHADDADQLALEWDGHWRDALGAMQDTGDHAPMSEWIEGWYAKLEAVLGVNLMELSHLRDIWVLNYTLPVVFNANAANAWCVEQIKAHPSDSCRAEYRRHFAGTKYAGPDPFATAVLHHGFSGVVSYWVVWGACEAATWGTGWFVICTPAGDLAEWGIEKYVAPGTADALYDRANK